VLYLLHMRVFTDGVGGPSGTPGPMGILPIGDGTGGPPKLVIFATAW
jgi:hypothetical protein